LVISKNQKVIGKYVILQKLALRSHEERLSLDEHKTGGNFLFVIKLVAQ